jgi:hypothetical protein
MRRAPRLVLGLLAISLAVVGLAGTSATAGSAGPPKAHPPSKVVVIVVDGLSREIVEKYKMRNVQALMRSGADAPQGYLGHLGAVTVVTHNVITTGALPKNQGWTDEGYRDVDGVLADQATNGTNMWLTSNFGSEQIFPLQEHAGYPKLAEYLHAKRPGSTVVAISPKTYAAWGLGGADADRTITFSGRNFNCDGAATNNWRGPDGINVPAYLSAPNCGRYYVYSPSSEKYDTGISPAWLYPLDGNRYTVGFDPKHEGGDVWAADAAIATMKHEKKWSGVFVTLPGVDKSAHMWGSIDDPGGSVPMTHMRASTKVADEQVGKIVGHLRQTGQLDDTLVVLTSDHGSVPGRDFHGVNADGQGFYNWYYGTLENDEYLDPQPALQPLVNTGNVAMTYSDSMVRAWLKNQSPAKVKQAAAVMAKMPGVSAVWKRSADNRHFDLASPVRWDRMPSQAERAWFKAHAQELLDTTAAKYGADVIATLVDDTTYSVAGDHGGIQRRAQDIPIVFAGGGVGSKDLKGGVRSVDIMPTILKALNIKPTHKLDGRAYELPKGY